MAGLKDRMMKHQHIKVSPRKLEVKSRNHQPILLPPKPVYYKSTNSALGLLHQALQLENESIIGQPLAGEYLGADSNSTGNNREYIVKLATHKVRNQMMSELNNLLHQ